MPVYKITDNMTGKTLRVRGDSPPTEEESAALFAANVGQGAPKPQRNRTWTDTAVDALPAVGGAAGGLIGGIGGTVAGMGVGGVPGAIGGATLGGGAGEAAKQLINRARGAGAPGTMGGAASDIGIQGGVQGALEGAGQAAMPLLKAGGEAVYRGYLKPSLSRVNLPKAAQIVKDAISEALPVTAGGVQRAQDLIGQLNGKVNTLLSDATGKTVDLGQIAGDVRAWATRMYDRPGRDPRDLKAALSVADRIDQSGTSTPARAALGDQMSHFIDQPSDAVSSAAFGKQAPVKGPTVTEPVSMPVANQVKRDLQGSVRDKFGVPGGTAETAAEKFGSATTRKAIETQVPAVGPLNTRESSLIDVARSIRQAVAREGNQNQLVGVKSLASAAYGGEEYHRTGDPYGAAAKGLALRAGLHPAVATRAAIIAAQLGAKMPGTAAADIARAAVQVVSEAQQAP